MSGVIVRGVAICALTVASVVSVALADDAIPTAEDARARQAQGEAYFEAGNFDAALVEFQRVYELLEGNPSRYLVLFNIGQCQERLFRYDDALRSYEAYLEVGGPEAEDREMVEATIRALDGMLATLTIETNAAEAEIWVDDRLLGTAPGAVRVPPGNHSVELRAEGFSPGRQQVELSTHASRTLAFELEPLGAGGGIPPAFFLSGAGATAVALGVAIGFGVDAMTSSSRIDALQRSEDAAEYGSVWQGDLDRVRELALIADVMYSVAGALAVGSFVMLLVTDWGGGDSSAETPTAWIVPVLGDGSFGVGAQGAF